LASLNRPCDDVADETILVTPDFSSASNWAALPGTENGSAACPPGVHPASDAAKTADVFFLHPTTYPVSGYHGFGLDELSRANSLGGWNQSSNDAQTRLWIDDLLKRQASVFNGACRVFAPRYRQASLMVLADLVVGDGRQGEAALAMAYGDVRMAFNYYLDHYNQGRPFVLAGHSQGAFHGLSLLRECVSGAPLRRQLIAAYLIGINLTDSDLAELTDIPACSDCRQIHCVIGYRSWSDGVPDDVPADNLCVNPVGPHAWHGGKDQEPQHLGAVTLSRESGQLTAPVVGACRARCRDGALIVSELDREFLQEWPGQAGNLHSVDFDLFHMNLRHDVEARVAAHRELA